MNYEEELTEIYMRGRRMKTIEKIKIMLEAPARTLIDAYRTFLKEMLEEFEKHRWHDLKKDPDDLPNKCGTYIVYIGYPEEEVGMAYYENMYWYRRGRSRRVPNYGNVIAWREIEPFEEDEA